MIKIVLSMVLAVFLFGCGSMKTVPESTNVRHDANVSMVKFEFDSSVLDAADKSTLDAVVAANNEKYGNNYTMAVVGRTDHIASNEYNTNLGLRRAETVAAYLREQNVTVAFVQSMGESDPVVIDPYVAQNFDNIAVRETNRSVTLITMDNGPFKK